MHAKKYLLTEWVSVPGWIVKRWQAAGEVLHVCRLYWYAFICIWNAHAHIYRQTIGSTFIVMSAHHTARLYKHKHMCASVCRWYLLIAHTFHLPHAYQAFLNHSLCRFPPLLAAFVCLLFALKCIKLQTEMIDGSGCVDLCATSLLRRIFAHFFLYAHAYLQTHIRRVFG